MKSTQAQVDEIEYQLKAKGLKYFDRVSLACVTDKRIIIDTDDISLPTDITLRQKDYVISKAIERIFKIVHQPFCSDKHRLTWQFAEVKGRIETDLPEKVWVRRSRHPIRRFMP